MCNSLARPGSGAGDRLVPGVSLSLRDPGPAHECQHLSEQSHNVGILLSVNIYSELDVQFQISGRRHLKTKWASQPGSGTPGPWWWDTNCLIINTIWFLFDARHQLCFVGPDWSHNVQDLQRAVTPGDGGQTRGPGHQRERGAQWENCHKPRPATTISQNLIFCSQIRSQMNYKIQSKIQQQKRRLENWRQGLKVRATQTNLKEIKV